MPRTGRTNLFLGLFFVAFALILIFVWIPLDTATGIVGTVRRRPVIGDSMAPTVAGLFLLVGGVLVAVVERNAPRQHAFDAARMRFVATSVALVALGFVVMRHAGTAAVGLWNLLTGADLGYRPLRDTFPWKYIGFFLGSAAPVAAISALTERRFGWKHVLVGAGAALLMILGFDLPFEDILLPPNGDL